MNRKDATRFEEFVQSLEARPRHTGRLLLYGSSFFTFWGYERAAEMLGEPDLPVCNHGFGGAWIEDLLHYYERLVRAYRPRGVLLRTGVNDLAGGLEVPEAFDLLAALCDRIVEDFPGIRLGVIPIFDVPRPTFEELRPRFAEFNARCRAFADRNPSTVLLDLNDLFYENPADVGTYRGFRPIFSEDGLHLTPQGYEAVASAMKARIRAAFL